MVSQRIFTTRSKHMEGHDKVFLDAMKWHSKYPLSARSRREFIQLSRALETVAQLKERVQQ